MEKEEGGKQKEWIWETNKERAVKKEKGERKEMTLPKTFRRVSLWQTIIRDCYLKKEARSPAWDNNAGIISLKVNNSD
jgi:hypothetical protein